MLRWVRLSKYCADAGETHDAVEKRIRAGHWLKGVHARKPDGSSELWVNLDAVNDWCEGQTPTHLHGRRAGSETSCSGGVFGGELAGHRGAQVAGRCDLGTALARIERSSGVGRVAAEHRSGWAPSAESHKAAEDTVDTAGIAVLAGCTRGHATDKLTKQPDFPSPVMNASQRLRRWRRADVLRHLNKDI